MYSPLLALILALFGAKNDTLPTAAVVAFEALGANAQDAEILTERFRTELSSRGAYRLVERSRMDEILREQGFQQTGCTSTECAVQTGRLLGVRRTIAGSVSKMGGTWSVAAREIDVETGEILRTAVVDIHADVDEVLTSGMGRLADRLLGRTARSETTAFISGLRQAFASTNGAPKDSAPQVVATAAVEEPDPPPPPGSVPFQFVLAFIPMPEARSVNGVALDLGWGHVEHLHGVQAGIANQVDSVLRGVQGGVVNLAGTQHGVQGGVINYSGALHGIQGGLINASGESRGLQVGLVNISEENAGIQFGLLNLWKRKGSSRVFPLVGGLF